MYLFLLTTAQGTPITLVSYGCYLYFPPAGKNSRRTMESSDREEIFFSEQSFTILTDPTPITSANYNKSVCFFHFDGIGLPCNNFECQNFFLEPTFYSIVGMCKRQHTWVHLNMKCFILSHKYNSLVLIMHDKMFPQLMEKMCRLHNFFLSIPEKAKMCLGFYWNCIPRDVKRTVDDKKECDDDNMNHSNTLFITPNQYHSWTYRIGAKKWYKTTERLKSKHALRSKISKTKKQGILIDDDLPDDTYLADYVSGSDSEFIPGTSSQRSKQKRMSLQSYQSGQSKRKSKKNSSKSRTSTSNSKQRSTKRKSRNQQLKKSSSRKSKKSSQSLKHPARRSPRRSTSKQKQLQQLIPLSSSQSSEQPPTNAKKRKKNPAQTQNVGASKNGTSGNGNMNKKQKLLTGQAKSVSNTTSNASSQNRKSKK